MKETLKIDGMTCDHCVMHVTNALESVEGVEKAKVSLKKKEALVKFDAPAGSWLQSNLKNTSFVN